MSDTRITLTCENAQQGWQEFDRAWKWAKPRLIGGQKLDLEVKPAKRTGIQNRRLWAMLRDVSEQVLWHGQRLSDGEFKDMFTAALKRQKVVPGLDGGFVVLGSSTSKMTRAEMCDLQDLITAFGNERGVQWSDPKWLAQMAEMDSMTATN